jgi:hypothetical protein
VRRNGLAATGAALLALAGLALATPGAFGGYSAVIRNSTNTAGTATTFRCAAELAVDSSSAVLQWPLTDASGSASAADISGKSHPGTYSGTMTASTPSPIACPQDPGSAWLLDGSAQTAVYPTQQTGPNTFSIEIWFRTTVAGGKLIGFGTNTGVSGQYDRHLYLDKNGAVVFGVYANAIKTVQTSTTSYADGRWHSAVGTLSSAGMALYVDGALASSDSTVITGEADSGYWKVGYDTLGGSWPNVASAYFTGNLRFAAVYSTALSASQVRAHDVVGR